MGLSAVSLSVLLDACQKIAKENPTPSIPSPSPTPTPSPTQSAIAISDALKIRHLLRRAGFGATPNELKEYTQMGLSATVDHLVEYQNVDDSALETRLTGLNIDQTKLADIQRWWLVRMIYSQRPLLEKMTLFWHGILTSAFSKVGSGQFMITQNQLLRDHALDDYGVLLKAISRDPAMLTWLDSRTNRKAAPNENFARELMELFTLGIGNYGETDVRESARAFTGWSQVGDNFVFDATQHDNGIETFLGHSGNYTGDDIIDIIMAQLAAAQYISRKLFEYFTYDNPDPSTITRLAAVFTSSNHSIKAVVKEILSSNEFYSARAYRAKIKSPAELVASAVRMLGIETSGAELIGPVSNMGQALFNPPDVSGWKGGMAWINSDTLLYRLNFANQVATARSANFKFNPADLMAANNITSPSSVVDYLVSQLVDGVMSSPEKDILSTYAAGMNILSAPPGQGKSTNDQILRSLVYLTLASPDYQLA
jgi:uncharacterized protein (DUF1800 family)